MSGRKIGTGITEREDWQPKLDLDLEFLSEVEKLAWEMLGKARLSKKELLRRARNYAMPGSEEAVLILAAQKATAKKIDSDEWSAALWLRMINGIRSHLEHSPKLATWEAFELGKACTQRFMKHAWERAALDGIGRQEGRSKGGDNRGAKNIGRDRRLVELYESLEPEYGQGTIGVLHRYRWKSIDPDPKSKPLSLARIRDIVKPRRRRKKSV